MKHYTLQYNIIGMFVGTTFLSFFFLFFFLFIYLSRGNGEVTYYNIVDDGIEIVKFKTNLNYTNCFLTGNAFLNFSCAR